MGIISKILMSIILFSPQNHSRMPLCVLSPSKGIGHNSDPFIDLNETKCFPHVKEEN